MEEVEEFLDDQRLEERLGGAFDKRKDSDIFILDKSINGAIPGKFSKYGFEKSDLKVNYSTCRSHITATLLFLFQQMIYLAS